MCERLEKVYIKNKRSFYAFKCSNCEKIFTARGDSKPKSCGCLTLIKYKKVPKDSQWVILGTVTNQLTKVLCKCTCGIEKMVYPDTIFTGKSKSCGCTQNATILSEYGIIGIRKHLLYGIWDAMKQRCYNPNNKAFKHYGAKGVTVCEEWKNDSAAFIKWSLDNNWNTDLTLDKDLGSRQLGLSVGVYSPDTCKWVTRQEQSHAMCENLVVTNTSGHRYISWNTAVGKYETYFSRKGYKGGKRQPLGFFEDLDEAIAAVENAIIAYYEYINKKEFINEYRKSNT